MSKIEIFNFSITDQKVIFAKLAAYFFTLFIKTFI